MVSVNARNPPLKKVPSLNIHPKKRREHEVFRQLRGNFDDGMEGNLNMPER